ncbi:molybdopterin-dependent oxidoreductase [Halopenitus sp. H-Gu1]|uniref:molybdopterin-dependent oxidoreductase n=1 Tax=Halopenitus sp. H-Gu1 TaxID=3242697 RepID=UPI00359D4AFE
MTPHTPIDADESTDQDASGTSRSETIVTVVGSGRLALTERDVAAFDHVERADAIECASGERTSGTWRGIPVRSLLLRVDAPPETTHVSVTGADGYSVMVEIRSALDGLLAFGRDGVPLADRDEASPRFVAPDVDGSRAVAGVVEMEAISLDPDADPESFEVLWPDTDAESEAP